MADPGATEGCAYVLPGGLPEGGLAAYVIRLRDHHRMTSTGCICDHPICPQGFLLAHIEDMRAAYAAKVQDFATETLRASLLQEEVDRLRAERDDGPPSTRLVPPCTCSPDHTRPPCRLHATADSPGGAP